MIYPRISIVTPVYNAEGFIEETIASVLDQNYPNLQYIVIDGGSTDKTPDIIRKYEKYLDYWASEPDKGQSDAIAKGLKLCNGEVFNWLNADDCYKPNALKLVGDLFADPRVRVFAGLSRIFGLNVDKLSPGTDIYSGNIAKTIARARIDQPETFFRRKDIDSLGGINKNLHYLMDRELWIRYLLRYGLKGIVKTKSILVNFRLHPTSKSVSQVAGFESEQQLLTRELCGPMPSIFGQDIEPNLRNLIRIECILYNYELSYASRDWHAMKRWRKTLLKYYYCSSVASQLLNLEVRRKLLSLV